MSFLERIRGSESSSACLPNFLKATSVCSLVALAIVGFVLTSGTLGGVVGGGLTIGLGTAGIAAGAGARLVKPQTPSTNENSFANKGRFIAIALVALLLCVTVGALGIGGIMTGVQIGWILTAFTIACLSFVALALCCFCCACCAGIGLAVTIARIIGVNMQEENSVSNF